jgi:hypothetical protein
MADCSVNDCNKEEKRRGYCFAHYQRWQTHGDTSTVLKPYGRYSKPTCSVDGCDDDVRSRGWCNKHYQRWKTKGDPLSVKLDRDKTLEERFWEKVNKHGPISDYRPNLGPCWVWTGAKVEGYGVIQLNGRPVKAHILSFTWAKGPIEEGRERDHLCRNRACVRPDHLEAVSHWTNVARGISPHGLNATKVHCPKGHLYDETNTRVDSKGRRHCRTCRNEASRRYYLRRRAAAKEIPS